MATVTVRRVGAGRVNARYTSEFSRLPGQKFDPFDLAEMSRDLRVSALLSPREARDLVLGAHEKGVATIDTGEER